MKKALRVGKNKVMAAIEDFPATQHDRSSFTVDVEMAHVSNLHFDHW